jgi:hypothetical protein
VCVCVCVCARARASACVRVLKKKILARPLPALKLVREQPHVFNLAERHAQIGAVRGVARLLHVCHRQYQYIGFGVCAQLCRA